MSRGMQDTVPDGLADGPYAMIEDAFDYFGNSDREREVMAMAVEIMGSQEGARAWLRTAHPALGGKAPRIQATTAIGQRRVMRLLGAIANCYEA